MNIVKKIFVVLSVSVVMACATVIVQIVRDRMTFTQVDDETDLARVERFSRVYEIRRRQSDGSGAYTMFEVLRLDSNGEKTLIGDFTTCGKISIERDRILFFEPTEFHCGLLTSTFDDWFNPKISMVEFNAKGERAVHVAR